MTVVGAKEVRIALVSYTDSFGVVTTKLAAVGNKNVIMLDGTLVPENLKKGIIKKLEAK